MLKTGLLVGKHYNISLPKDSWKHVVFQSKQNKISKIADFFFKELQRGSVNHKMGYFIII
jgi:hypothetical protein